jgi:hypothetical protein
MIAKYILASLLTVSRTFGTFTPWCVDLMSCVCTTTIAKTAMSKGTGRRFNRRNERIRKSDEMLTKGEREGRQNDCQGSLAFGKA